MELLLFGITKEIIGTGRLSVDQQFADVAALKAWLHATYPPLEKLRSLAVAVNREYADDQHSLTGTEEIALIPPVSGG